MRVVDSSFLVSLFWPDDSLHDKAETDFSNSQETFLLLDRVVEETLTVLTYRSGLKPSLEIVSRLLRNDRFQLHRLSDSDWRDILEYICQSGKKISFTDYAVAFVSCQWRTFPLTYDKQISALVKKEKESGPGWAMDELLYGGNEPHSRNFKPKD
jgi:predicted nucleic acid-binding protein